MKAVIIEDEVPAQINLRRALERSCGDVEVIAIFDSVRSSVRWFSEGHAAPDVIFMDVELSDGMCFDIFNQVEITAPVIITTAYDNYALKAFRVHSIDYLLKPVDPDELRSAVDRCRAAIHRPMDIEALRDILIGGEPVYRPRFIMRLGDRIIIVRSDDVAYFCSEDKSTFLVTNEGKRYVMDMSLDAISDEVDPRRFFRISRNCTVSINAIVDINRHLSNRLKVTLNPPAGFDVFVSRSRTSDFLDWISGK